MFLDRIQIKSKEVVFYHKRKIFQLCWHTVRGFVLYSDGLAIFFAIYALNAKNDDIEILTIKKWKNIIKNDINVNCK